MNVGIHVRMAQCWYVGIPGLYVVCVNMYMHMQVCTYAP
jgi:hypothetical protein